MPEIIRTRESRYRTEDISSDDERSSSYGRSTRSEKDTRGGYRTVQRYRVTPSHRAERLDPPSRVERIERTERIEEIDDVRSIRSERRSPPSRNERIEIDRKVERIERPRSSFDPDEREKTISKTVVYERERPREREYEPEFESKRTVVYERERPREREPEPEIERERTRTVVYERPRDHLEPEIERERTRTVVYEREREPEPEIARERTRTVVYEREREPEPEVRREQTKTVVYEREREPDSARPWERERDRPWEREREVDVRIERRHHEEAPEREIYQRETEYYDRPEHSAAPLVVRERKTDVLQAVGAGAALGAAGAMMLPRAREEEVRGYEMVRREEIDPREDYYYRREHREIAPVRRERDYEYERREERREPSEDEYSDGAEIVVHRERRVVRARSESPRHHHKLHLAEGALAGAGAAALLANHRSQTGEGGDHKAGKVVSGAALGAIGAELVTRARSHYRDQSRNRSRSSSRNSHHKLKIGLGIAAAAIAAAAAGKYVQNRNRNAAEDGRGRSRTRSVSRRRRYSNGDVSEEEVVSAETKHMDPAHRKNTIAKVGVGAAAVAGVVEAIRSRSKKRNGQRSQSRLRTGTAVAATGLAGAALAGLYENRKAKQDAAAVDAGVVRGRRTQSRSLSRRSRSRSVPYSDPGVDPELGMVQYGADPVYATTQERTAYNEGYYPTGEGVPVVPAAVVERSRSRSRRDRTRSRSRVRDLASGALATGAAAIGIDQYRKRKERKEAERERRRFEEETPGGPENYYAAESYDDGYSPSPPRPSYPIDNLGHTTAGPGPVGFTEHTTTTTHMPGVNHVPDPLDPRNNGFYGGGPADFPRSGSRTRGDNVSKTNKTPDFDFQPSGIPPKVPLKIPVSHQEIPVSRFREEDSLPEPLEATVEGRLNRRRRLPHPPIPSDTFSDVSNAISSASEDEEHPAEHNRKVSFALQPLPSPSTTRPVENLGNADSAHANPSLPRPDLSLDTSPDPPLRRRRRNSDPTANRGAAPLSRRERERPMSPEVEELPARFDSQGRPLDGSGRFPRDFGPRGHGPTVRSFSVSLGPGGFRTGRMGGRQQEMVERIVGNIGDVLEGRGSWKSLLANVLNPGEVGDGLGSGQKRRR